MARLVSTYTESAAGRDHGKKFVVTEMDPRSGHRWASRLLFAILNSGGDVSPEILSAGLAGVARMGIAAALKIPHDVAEPLMDELLECVEVLADNGIQRQVMPGDIEEILTIFRLQISAWNLHIEPFMRGVKSISESATAPDKSTA